MTLDSQNIGVSYSGTINSALDFQSISIPMQYAKAIGMSSGTGGSQSDRLFADQRTIAASSNDDLDVNAGTLVDALGVTFTVARLKLILVYAAAANTNNVVIGGAASNPVNTFMTGTTPAIIVRPGGFVALAAPDAVAYGVTAATGDILRISNSGAGSSVTYDIVLVGSSA